MTRIIETRSDQPRGATAPSPSSSVIPSPRGSGESEQEELVRIASRSDAHVLITGPTGVGKSTLARRIHESGSRRAKPFMAINLATLHEGTLESELFGHERGAFTGADQKKVGKLESAQGGTVFLDEIGELPLKLQARLLDLLQTKTISPVGSTRQIRLDVRIIAATHQDLGEAVCKGRFREDLFHRLRVIGIRLNSILDSSGELDQIIHACLEQVSAETGVRILGIDEDVASAFEAYSWPGNFREMRNVLEFATLSATSGRIRVGDLPKWFLEAKTAEENRLFGATQADGLIGVAEVPLTLDYAETLSRFERQYLACALRRYRGRVNQTARSLKISKTTLIRRIRAFGLANCEA